MNDLYSYSTSELKAQADSQYELLRLSSKNELEFRQKVLKVKTDLKNFFKSEHSVYIEQQDLDAIKNTKRIIGVLGLGVMVPCFIASIYTRNFKILGNLNKFGEFAVRFCLLFGSTGGIYAYSHTQNQRLMAIMELKYAFRVQKFNVTKDPKAINPNFNTPST